MAVTTVDWPYQSGLIVAALTGVTVGMVLSRTDPPPGVVPASGTVE
jgi:hypothetical protein